MRAIVTSILAITITASVNAQGIKKQPKVTTPIQQSTISDSLVIKGAYRNDTAKVIAVLFVEDGTLIWQKGFIVSTSFVPTGGQPLSAGQVLYTDKFVTIKPEDVFDVKQIQWK